MRFQIPAIVLFLCVLQAPGNASVYLPAGLNPGDEYQLAFVTINLTTAVASTISTYNEFVMDDAGNNPLLGTSSGVTYTAIVSTYNGVDARVNAVVEDDTTNDDFMGVYNLDGQRIATGFTDMWDGSIEHPIGQDGIGPAMAWTGTQSSGHASDSPLGQDQYGSSDDYDATGGDPGGTGFWVDGQLLYQIYQKPLYGLSSVITVPDAAPVPEPASVITWALLGTVGCIGTWWNRRRKAS